MSTLLLGIDFILRSFLVSIPLYFFALFILLMFFKKRTQIMLGMLEMISVWLILAVTLCGVAVNIDINLYGIMKRINIIPFYGNWQEWKNAFNFEFHSMIQIYGNIMLFIPFGFFFFFIHRPSDKKMIVISLLFPIVIESIQLICGRVADIDDVICNFSGAMLGDKIGLLYLHRYGSTHRTSEFLLLNKQRRICFRILWISIFVIMGIRISGFYI